MVTIGMNYKVLEGKNEVFEQVFDQVIQGMQGLAGHQESHLFREVGHSQNYLILSVWTDQNAFNDFIQSEKFKKVTNWGKEQILADRPVHTTYQS